MRFILVTWLCALLCAGHAQTHDCSFSLQGRVVDVHDESPVSFATVVLSPGNLITSCDENGKFRFDTLCAGLYTIQTVSIGFTSRLDTVDIQQSGFIEIALEHGLIELNGVQVHGHNEGVVTTQKVNTIDGRLLERQSGKSLGALLKEVNGITTLQTGNSIAKPVIHGLHSNRILILNNGVRQEGQQWGNEHGPEIDPFVANTFTVIKGASSVQYGSDAIGGVILVNPAALRDSVGTSGQLQLVGMSNTYGGAAAALVEHRFAKITPVAFRIQGSAQREGNIHTPNYYLANTAHCVYGISSTIEYHQKDLRLEVYYSLYHADVGIFSGSHIGNLTDLENAFASDTPLIQQDFTYTIGRPRQSITHHLVKGVLDYHNEQLGTMLLTVAYQNDFRSEYDAHAPLNDSLAALHLPSLYFEIGSLTIDGSWVQHPTKYRTGKIGFNLMNQQNVTRYATFIPNFKNYSGGIFAVQQFSLTHWLLEAGIRYDYKWMQIYRYVGNALDTPERTFSHVSAQIGARYFDGKHSFIHLQAGSAWRAPAVSELYSFGLHHGAASLEYGNELLEIERSNQLMASYEHDSEKWFVDAGMYINYIRDFIYQQPTLPAELTIRGAFPVFHYQQDDALLHGGDVTIKYMLTTQLAATAKASTVRARNLETGTWIVMMPADRISGELSYSGKDLGSLHNWKVRTEVAHVFEQKRAEALEDYVAPPKGYTLVGASIEGDLLIHASTIGWSVEIENALNTAYRDYLNRFRYFADDMGRNITLRIKIPFN